MIDRTFRSNDRRFGVRWPAAAATRVARECRGAGALETGGILVGHYGLRHDLAIVTSVSSAPSDSRRARAWFERGVRGLQRFVHATWHRRGDYYLGEWHFHPDGDATPSDIDIDQMQQIARSTDYCCPEPILLIATRDTVGETFVRFWVFLAERSAIPLQDDAR